MIQTACTMPGMYPQIVSRILALLQDADAAPERAEYRVILHLIRHAADIGVSEVDGTYLNIRVTLLQNPQNHTRNPSKAIDSNSNRHVCSSRYRRD